MPNHTNTWGYQKATIIHMYRYAGIYLENTQLQKRHGQKHDVPATFQLLHALRTNNPLVYLFLPVVSAWDFSPSAQTSVSRTLPVRCLLFTTSLNGDPGLWTSLENHFAHKDRKPLCLQRYLCIPTDEIYSKDRKMHEIYLRPSDAGSKYCEPWNEGPAFGLRDGQS